MFQSPPARRRCCRRNGCQPALGSRQDQTVTRKVGLPKCLPRRRVPSLSHRVHQGRASFTSTANPQRQSKKVRVPTSRQRSFGSKPPMKRTPQASTRAFWTPNLPLLTRPPKASQQRSSPKDQHTAQHENDFLPIDRRVAHNFACLRLMTKRQGLSREIERHRCRLEA